jgi:integrase
LVGFHCYLRAGEIARLQRKDVVVPNDPRMGSAYTGMVLRLARTKTGLNQSVSITDPHIKQLLLAWLQRHSHSASPSDRLFPFTDAQFRSRFHRTVYRLGLGHIRYVPHSLRHGGATRDYMRGMSIEDVMYRGRWKTMESARRYIQQSRAMLVQQDVPKESHKLGVTFSRCMVPLMQHLMATVPEKRPRTQQRVRIADQQ